MALIFDLAGYIIKGNPGLKRLLRIAKVKQNPKEFVAKGLRLALFSGIAMTVLMFFMFDRLEIPLVWLLIVFPLTFTFTIFFILQTPYGMISKREREINKEVLFAGRYLLVKMESGYPLFNTLIDASKSYGVCAEYFKEIVDEINTGTPIEEALETAREYNASDKFKRILWQIITSLNTGADVADPLRATLKSITEEQILEIKAYSKKLNSLMMFYMVIACVMPSIGVTMFIILSGFIQLEISQGLLFSLLFFIAVIQLSFISLIRGTRPMVNL